MKIKRDRRKLKVKRAQRRLERGKREDFRVVVEAFEFDGKRGETRYIVLAEEADVLVERRRMMSPSREFTIEALSADVALHRLCPRGPYWWSTPGIQSRDFDPNGALIFEDCRPKG